MICKYKDCKYRAIEVFDRLYRKIDTPFGELIIRRDRYESSTP